jgi:Zn-finger nucleic acid-binding protein
MKCPNCVAVDLLLTDRQGIEIDYCPSCRGVWLDRGELDKFIQSSELNGNDRSARKQSDYNDELEPFETEL